MRFVGLSGFCFVVIALWVTPLSAQITVGGSSPLTYTQDFNSLPSSGSPNYVQYDQTGPTLPGWFAVRTGPGTTIVVGDGNNSGGNLYSFGATSNSDRALGSIGSGSVGSLAWGVVIQNTGTSSLTVNVQYSGEQWRNSGAAAQTLVFSYLLTSSLPASGSIPIPTADNGIPTGYTQVSSLNFTAPVSGGSATLLNGNASANRITFDQDIGLNLAANQYVVFHWSDPNHSGNVLDHGLSIDDVTFTFTPVPEPATVLAIAVVGLGLVGGARQLRRRTVAGTC